ncbi:MAG: hypothetical protein ACAH59_09715, partial [Pseudobdellovibrionaceae bacterium]
MENLSFSATDQTISEIDLTVLQGVETLAGLSTTLLGRPVKAHSRNAMTKLSAMSGDRKQAIQNQINVMKQIVSGELQDSSVESINHPEWLLVAKAMKLYGLNLKDDFQSILQKDDVIEIYNSDHIQIFRTFNFYRYSGYSYLDLLVNEWFHLWERPRYILESMLAVGMSVVNGDKKGVVSMGHIPEHVYKEIYNSEDVQNFESRSV